MQLGRQKILPIYGKTTRGGHFALTEGHAVTRSRVLRSASQG